MNIFKLQDKLFHASLFSQLVLTGTINMNYSGEKISVRKTQVLLK